MSARKSISVPVLIALSGAVALPVPALAQSTPARGGTLSSYEAGYANGRAMDSRTFDPSTRDANGNRLIINGILQADAAGQTRSDGMVNSGPVSGADYFSTGASTGSTTAVGNLLTVTVDGSWNTVIVNSSQANTGDVVAGGPVRPR
jgi:holdfast attachment protein HfaA